MGGDITGLRNIAWMDYLGIEYMQKLDTCVGPVRNIKEHEVIGTCTSLASTIELLHHTAS